MSEAAIASPPTITTKDVEEWCALAQVKDGKKILQKGDVLRPWQAGTAIHAEVQGSGATPYRIDITFKEGANKPSPKCSCPAWRSNPFCKHVTAVLLAWSGKAESFAVVEAPVVEVKAKPTRTPKKEASRTEGTDVDTITKPKGDAKFDAERLALLESGLSQATDLLEELCARGLLAVTAEQTEATKKLAELLLDQQTIALGHTVQLLAIRLSQLSVTKASGRHAQETIDESSFTALLAKAWLTLAATRNALHADSGDADSAFDVEDLLGRKFDESRLNKSQSAALLEIAFEEETDEIGFVTDTSYLLELESGEVLLERRILPVRLADKGRKRPYNSLLLNCQIGSRLSQPPRRVKVSSIGQKQPITAEILARAARHAVATVAVLRRRHAAQIIDPLAARDLLALFAPEALQVVEAPPLQGRGSQSLLLVDAEGIALPVESISAANAILGVVIHEPISALFGRLKLNERGDALVFAPLSILCSSGKLHIIE